jgi:hypothetical protein
LGKAQKLKKTDLVAEAGKSDCISENPMKKAIARTDSI